VDPTRGLQHSVFALLTPFLARSSRAHAPLDRAAGVLALEPYLLGLLNTAYLTARDGPVSEAQLRDVIPYGTRSRLGPDHWDKLIAQGFARRSGGGWLIASSGVAAVEALHAAVQAEIDLRVVPAAPTERSRTLFGAIAGVRPRTPRASILRDLWDGPESPLVELYRCVWEVLMFRDACYRAAWDARGYHGLSIALLSELTPAGSPLHEIELRLASKQTPGDVSVSLEDLVARGDAERDTDGPIKLSRSGTTARQQVEAQTDADFFDAWPAGPDLEDVRSSFIQVDQAVAASEVSPPPAPGAR